MFSGVKLWFSGVFVFYLCVCVCRKGSSVQAEAAHHVSALEQHVWCSRPQRTGNACGGQGQDGWAKDGGYCPAWHPRITLQERERQTGDLGQCLWANPDLRWRVATCSLYQSKAKWKQTADIMYIHWLTAIIFVVIYLKRWISIRTLSPSY